MHSKSENIEIMMNNEADEIIEELFNSHKNRYENNVESTRGSGFAFDYVHLLYYKCHKRNPNCSGLYINSPDWIKYKKISIKKIINVFNMLLQSREVMKK